MFALPELKLTGPSLAMPGEISSVSWGIARYRREVNDNPIFNQLDVAYIICSVILAVTVHIPSITFDMPVVVSLEDVKFELVLNINGKPYATPPHAVTLKCIDIANEDVESKT